MDNEKLEALRHKYADAKGGDIFDPELAAVARRRSITYSILKAVGRDRPVGMVHLHALERR